MTAILNVKYINDDTPFNSHKFYVNKLVKTSEAVDNLIYPDNFIYFAKRHIKHKLISGKEYKLEVNAIINSNTKKPNIKTVIVKEVSKSINTYFKKEPIEPEEPEELEEPKEPVKPEEVIINANNKIIKLTDDEVIELKEYIRFIIFKRNN